MQPQPQQLPNGGIVHNAGTTGGYAMQIDVGQGPSAHFQQPVALHGQWRDNLFDCCGVDGPSSYCMACMFPVCTPCLYAKIASRISCAWESLRCWGPNTFSQWFRFISVLAVLYVICSFNYSMFHSLAIDEYQKDIAKSPYHNGYYKVQVSDETRELATWAEIFDLASVFLSVLFVVLLALLRQRVRQRFLIPAMCETRAGENPCCGIMEDVSCMVCCWVCSLAQMARHTYALIQGDRCDPYSDPGPIEVFPAAHAMPVMLNNMPHHQHPQMQFQHPQTQFQHPQMRFQHPQTQFQHPQMRFQQPQMHQQGYVPPAYYAPHSMQGAPTASAGVEVGQLVQDSFPTPASTAEAPVATTIHQAPLGVHVPVATHVPEASQGVTRDQARG